MDNAENVAALSQNKCIWGSQRARAKKGGRVLKPFKKTDESLEGFKVLLRSLLFLVKP